MTAAAAVRAVVMTAGVAALLVSASPGDADMPEHDEPAGREPVAADSYRGQVSIRLWGGAGRPDLYGARVALHDENAAMRSDSWEGGVPEGDLTRAFAGGLEVSYGVGPFVKILVNLDGSGTSASGEFTGTGSRTVVDPVAGLQRQQITRLIRLAETGQELGATLLLREFGWCRTGLSGRLGVHELAGSVERGRETGPLGGHWWNRNVTAVAPSASAALEWEWLVPARSLPFPLTGFLLVGWRWLEFTKLSHVYTDDLGVTVRGGYNNPDGTHRTFSFSGPEVRFGLQIAWSPDPAL